jgi:hypothetical protein
VTYSQAFLSYTRIDDEYFGGNITSLRKLLELGVRVVGGDQSFQIFQDVDGIELGQQWQKRIGDAIISARFLIPILTPCFFSSHPCRDELTKFVEHEKALARDDLILPIYFVTVPSLEKMELRDSDPLAVELSKRQRFDWRDWSDLPISDPTVRRAVGKLSQQIVLACQRTSEVVVERAQAAIATRARDNQVDEKLQSAAQDAPGQDEFQVRSRRNKSIL